MIKKLTVLTFVAVMLLTGCETANPCNDLVLTVQENNRDIEGLEKDIEKQGKLCDEFPARWSDASAGGAGEAELDLIVNGHKACLNDLDTFQAHKSQLEYENEQLTEECAEQAESAEKNQ